MKKMRTSRLAGVAVGAIALTSGAAQAGFSSYDFESLAVGSGLSTVTGSDNGVDITIAQPGGSLGVVDFSAASGTPTLGARTVVPGVTTGGASLVVNLSVLADEFSAQLGDFGDDQDLLSLIAYSGLDGTGSVIASSTDEQLPPVGLLFSSKILTVTGAGIQSVAIIGGSGDNSVVYDNFVVGVNDVSAIPLPPAALAAVPVLGALIAKRARRAR